MSTIMGIDYGKKRLGIAISNPERTMSVPVCVIQVKDDDSHLKSIKKIINDYGVEEIVIGMPYNMDGTTGESGNSVMVFSDMLQNLFNIPVHTFDERLTTFEAHEILASISMDNKKRLKVVDCLAAKIILQGYLDSRSL